MEKIYIVYVDDQREVLATIAKELTSFEEMFILEECETASEALELIDEIDEQGDYLALVISDHIMPGQSGVEFLSDIHNDNRFSHTRKILLTGMATHKDTILAINNARIDRYIEKPWNPEELILMVKELVTQYIFESGIDYKKYIKVLDQKIIYESLRKATE